MRAATIWFLIAAGVLSGQVTGAPPHYVEIEIPPSVDSAKVFIRYVLDHDFGGWVDAREDVSSYFIGTTRNGHAANRLKVLVYAPGCAIDTFDLQISRTMAQQVAFNCRAVPSIQISGVLSGLSNAHIQAKYQAQWVQDFFGQADGIVTLVPVAHGMYFADSGHFRLSIPDFSGDDRLGEMQFWATDPASGKLLARLVPAEPLPLNFSRAPVEGKFALCGTPASQLHDAFGFALRGQEEDRTCAAIAPHIKR